MQVFQSPATQADFFIVNRLRPYQFDTLLAMGRGDGVPEIARARGVSANAVYRSIQRIKRLLEIDTIWRTRAFATRFLVFTETTPFVRADSSGQIEMKL